MDIICVMSMTLHGHDTDHVHVTSLIRIRCMHHADGTRTDERYDAPVMRHIVRHADVTHMSDVIRVSGDTMK